MNRRILFIDEDQERNGATVSMEYLVRGFAQAGCDVTVLSWKQQEWTKALLKTSARLLDGRWGPLVSPTMSFHFTYAAPALSWKNLKNAVKDCVKCVLGFVLMRRVIRQVKPDLVYLNEYSVAQAALAARSCGVPTAVHIRSRFRRGTFGLRGWLLSRTLLRCTDAVFAITGIEAEQLKPRPREAAKVRVVGEFVPLSHDAGAGEAARRELFGLPAGKNVVVMVGGIQEIKGTRDFLEAGKQALTQHPDALLVLMGGTATPRDPAKIAYHMACMDVVQELQRGDGIRLVGEITNPLDLLAVADALVAPTRDTHFARPVVEAWGVRKPVIAYRIPHMLQLIEDGVDGLLVEPGNLEALADAIVRLLEDTALGRRLGEAGHRKAVAGFDAVTNVTMIVTHCLSLCGAR